MSLPKKQYVLSVTRGRTTKYFYGSKLKDLLGRVKVGENFSYASLSRSDWKESRKTAEDRYTA